MPCYLIARPVEGGGVSPRATLHQSPPEHVIVAVVGALRGQSTEDFKFYELSHCPLCFSDGQELREVEEPRP